MSFVGTGVSAACGWLNRHGGAALSTLLNGLVSYWPLNEQSGTRADVVGSNDLTDNNTVGSVNSGPKGVVGSFVAASSESLSKDADVFAAQNDFSVAVWLDGDATQGGANTRLISRDSNGSWDYALLFNGGGSAWYVLNPTGGLVSVNGSNVGAGMHLLVCGLDTIQQKAWISVDGAAKSYSAAYTGTLALNASKAFTLGSMSGGGNHYQGKMGPVGFWNSAIGDYAIASLFNSGNGKRYADLTDDEKVGLVSYWNLDEASGTRADSHGSNDLTDNNTVGSVINAGGAMDGAAASFVNANNESLSLTGGNFDSPDYSISFWHKPSTVGSTYSFLVTLGDAWNAQIGLVAYRYEDDLYVGSGKDGSGFQAATALQALTDDAWHHVVIWFDSSDSKAKMQINGGSVLETAALDGPRFNATKFRISQEPAGTGFAIDGEMDEVAIWSRVLTEDERAELYALGAGKFYPFTE